jgi:hypothetical protein
VVYTSIKFVCCGTQKNMSYEVQPMRNMQKRIREVPLLHSCNRKKLSNSLVRPPSAPHVNLASDFCGYFLIFLNFFEIFFDSNFFRIFFWGEIRIFLKLKNGSMIYFSSFFCHAASWSTRDQNEPPGAHSLTTRVRAEVNSAHIGTFSFLIKASWCYISAWKC